MAAALDDVDRVAARYRPPVEIPRSGSGRSNGLTSDCIELLLQKGMRGVSLVFEAVLTKIVNLDYLKC
jgi:hypothetical protein